MLYILTNKIWGIRFLQVLGNTHACHFYYYYYCHHSSEWLHIVVLDLLVIYLSSLENLYSNCSPIFISVIGPSMVELKEYLYLLDTSLLLDIWFTNICPYLVHCLFRSLMVFSSTNILIVIKFNLFIFPQLFETFLLCLWYYCLIQNKKDLCLNFPLRILEFFLL